MIIRDFAQNKRYELTVSPHFGSNGGYLVFILNGRISTIATEIDDLKELRAMLDDVIEHPIERGFTEYEWDDA